MANPVDSKPNIPPYSFDYEAVNERQSSKGKPTPFTFNKYLSFLDNGEKQKSSRILSLPVISILKGAVRFTVGAVVATVVAGVAAAYFGFRKNPDLTVARDALAIGLGEMVTGLVEILHMRSLLESKLNKKLGGFSFDSFRSATRSSKMYTLIFTPAQLFRAYLEPTHKRTFADDNGKQASVGAKDPVQQYRNDATAFKKDIRNDSSLYSTELRSDGEESDGEGAEY